MGFPDAMSRAGPTKHSPKTVDPKPETSEPKPQTSMSRISTSCSNSGVMAKRSRSQETANTQRQRSRWPPEKLEKHRQKQRRWNKKKRKEKQLQQKREKRQMQILKRVVPCGLLVTCDACAPRLKSHGGVDHDAYVTDGRMETGEISEFVDVPNALHFRRSWTAGDLAISERLCICPATRKARAVIVKRQRQEEQRHAKSIRPPSSTAPYDAPFASASGDALP